MSIKRFTINDFREMYPDSDACLDKIFQLRYNNLICPKCDNDKPFKRVKDRRSYQCPSCGFQVYPTQGTVFEKTTTPLTHWFYAIYLQTTTRNGVAAKELERQLNVCYKTALRMAHQIKILMMNKNREPFTGIVEIDDSAIGGRMTNKHKAVRKKFKEMKVKDNLINKSIVLGIVERGGKVVAEVVNDSTREQMEPIILQHVDYQAEVMTDTARVFENLKDNFSSHQTVDHSADEYRRGNAYTNTVEGFFSQLKRTIRGTHIHVSKRHLPKYVDEVAFRYSHRDQQDQMFEIILNRVV